MSAPETEAAQIAAGRALVERWADLFNRDVFRMIDECYAEDAEIEIAGSGLRGRDAFKATEAEILRAAPDRRLTVETVLIDGENIAVEGVILGSEAATGHRFAVPFAAFLVVKDGWIVRDRSYFDRLPWPSMESAVSGQL